MVLSIIDGSGNNLGTGALVAIFSIVMVFVILTIIILLMVGVSKIIELIEKKTIPALKDDKKGTTSNSEVTPLDPNDEDAVVAALVASIDYREETHQNVKVVSIKEIK